jgi:hypothetical protein
MVTEELTLTVINNTSQKDNKGPEKYAFFPTVFLCPFKTSELVLMEV